MPSMHSLGAKFDNVGAAKSELCNQVYSEHSAPGMPGRRELCKGWGMELIEINGTGQVELTANINGPNGASVSLDHSMFRLAAG